MKNKSPATLENTAFYKTRATIKIFPLSWMQGNQFSKILLDTAPPFIQFWIYTPARLFKARAFSFLGLASERENVHYGHLHGIVDTPAKISPVSNHAAANAPSCHF